ncbi:gap repair protein [Methylacidimicrobium sp. AP8]|uniref:recombination mediator RecR n=1 Tax=Methylacidimicrobium sp. AP8 TaxID=2730359 RepID=UPI0018C1999F|nr:recombination mediator RecR [Methylacidimicrobium sp. AP8]CAB4243247.1 gap repair protein [Methylacidimicrobium sp. AP8]
MADYPQTLRELLAALRELPSIGPRSAERLVLFLMEERKGTKERLARALHAAGTRVHPCVRCGFYAEEDLCELCRDPARDPLLWCLVASPGDVLRIERASAFRGVYHVLGHRLSPLEGIGPEQLPTGPLLARIEREHPREIILALGTDAEGEATSLYLGELLKKTGPRISSLATGLPAGGGLEFADSVTLSYALAGRREI